MMNNRQLKFPRCGLVIWLAAIVTVVGCAAIGLCAAPAKMQGDAITGTDLGALCEVMAADAKSNYDRIRTWRGKFRLTSRQRRDGISGVDGNRYTGIVWQQNSGVVDFAVDVVANKLYCTYITDGPPTYFTDDGEEVGGITASRIAEEAIVTPEHYLSFQPDIKYGSIEGFGDLPPNEITGRLAFRKPAVAAVPQKTMSSVVDPRRLFGDGSTDRLSFDIYAMYAKRLRRDERDPPFSINLLSDAQEGALIYEIEMRFKSTFGHTPLSRCEVNSELAYNMTSFAYWDDGEKLTREVKWEYARQDGIIVPKQYRVKRWDLDTGQFFFDRELVLVHSVLNGPLAESTFDYAAFALRRGDRVHDEVENRLLIADGEGSLVTPEKYLAHAPEPSAEPNRDYWVLILNIVCAIAVVSLCLAVRHRRLRVRRVVTHSSSQVIGD